MWHVSMHGSTDHLDPAVADEIEVAVRDAVSKIFGELVAAGHQGVAGTFAYSTGGPSDLRDATPHPVATNEEAPPPLMTTSTVPAETHDVGVPAGTAPE